jgi:RND family efflux transporter MFP subunit
MKLSCFLLAPVTLTTAFLTGCSQHEKSEKEDSGPHPQVVNFITTETKGTPTQLTLPAALQAFQETPIYARTTGFVEKWFFDIGDQVKAGQTLAIIEGPDLDQQLNQAKAVLGQTKANLNLAKISADRWKALGEQHAVAQQDVDTKIADYEARQADTKAAEANVERLVNLKQYQTVVAPYDGVVSARNAQVGALINAGSGSELYHISQVDPLRVYANVPQPYIRSIKPGLEVQVEVAEFQNLPFKGKVTRYAGALDATSRTLLVEIQIPNPHGELLPGMFCEVHFSIKADGSQIIIPSNTTLVRAEGAFVAAIDESNHLHLTKVRLGRDFGTQVEILDGLKAGMRIVANPTDALSDGLEVQPQDQKVEQQKAKQEADKQQKEQGKGEKKKPGSGEKNGS